MPKEINSQDVREGHLAAIAKGDLVVRENREPHGHESNEPGKTGGGQVIPVHLRRVGVTVGVHRRPETRLERATLVSIGEGVAIVQFAYDGAMGTVSWAQVEASAPAPAATE